MTDIGATIAQLQKDVERLKRASRLSSASLDDTALEVRDGSGSLRGMFGQQGDGTTAALIVNGPPPPQPSTPIVASVLGGVTASWDGLFTDGQVLPLDWSRTEVHASTSTSFTPDAATLCSTIETAQGATVVIPTDDPMYVRLVARSTSGTPSAPSVQAGPYGPTAVVATDIIDGIVTTVKLADDAVTAAKVAAAAVTPEALAPVLADTVSQRWVDTMDDPAAWAIVSQDPGATWTHIPVSDAASGGGMVGRAAGYTSVRGTTLIPHDPATMYRISVRIRASAQPPAGADTVYLGLMGFAADKTTMVNRTGANSSGSQYYTVASLQTVATADGWTVYTGFIQGRGAPSTSVSGGAAPDPLAPTVVHDQVRYITPYLLLNYTRRDNTGIMQVDTVSVEALRTGVVTAAYLAAGSVSTSKLVAGAVQTAQLDAEAVNASKIAAGAVTTAKLDALAVTADKIAANAITVGKLAAGSVDATALKADAITGKTITGGIINGAEFHSDDGAGGTVDIQSGTVTATGPNGWEFAILPNDSKPSVGFTDSTGLPAGHFYGSGNDTLPNLGIVSGPFTDPVVGVSRWLINVGTTSAGNRVWTRRVNNALTQVAGGEAVVDEDSSRISYIDPADATKNTFLSLYANLVTMTNARLVMTPPASVSPALHLNASASQTGQLLRVQLNGADRLTVTAAGTTAVAGTLTAAGLVSTGALTATGVLTAGNIVSGTVAITPSAANTPTSVSVTGLSVQGGNLRAYVSIANPAPGSTTSNNGVTGVGFSNLTTSGVTIWATRQNTTAVTVHWLIIGI